MSLKALYGLQSVLLATGRPTGDLLLDYNKIVAENQTKNKHYSGIYKDWIDAPKKLISPTKNELLIPVNLIIYDKYYHRISEWKYLDKYHYDKTVLVFDKKSYDAKKVNQGGIYKKHWLNNLVHSKNYHYLMASVYKYPQKKDSFNVNWISGGASSHSLRSILNLNLPQSVKGSFEMHKKIIELDQSFLMSPVISLFSGYWKNGELGKSNNVIQKVEYGNLKANSVQWSDLYHYDRGKNKTCSQLEESGDDELKVSRKRMSEGFDSQCGKINLLDFGSLFKQHQNRRIYSSGFVGYKYDYPAYWNTHTYFYSLGDWSLDKPSKYRVNKDNEERSLWFVDYDNVFVPEIKLSHEASRTARAPLGKRKFELSFYIDYKKVKDVKSFLKISTQLSFKLKFKYKAKDYEQKFTIKDVLKGNKFSFEEDTVLRRTNLGSFSNFELQVYSENSNIKLNSLGNKKEFSYKVNLSIVESRFSLIHGLLLDQEELKSMYYSELRKKEDLYKFFYLISRNAGNPNVKLIHLPKEWVNLLKVKLSGIDYSNSATLEYYDFIEGKTKKLELSNLLKLPTFDQEQYTRKDSVTSIEEIVSQQNSHKIGSYFWNKMKLQLKEKDLFNGTEKYVLQPKNARDKDISDWIDYYRGTEILVQGGSSDYLVKKENVVLDKSVHYSNYQKLFDISDRGKNEVGLNLSDFTFRKVFEDNNELEIEAEYNGHQGTKKVHTTEKVYEGVVFTGKARFKWNKNKTFDDSEDLLVGNRRTPIKYYSSDWSSARRSSNFGSDENGSSMVLPIAISSAGAGAGVIAGLGSLVFKKFKIALS
ncbi:hypothetical protein OVS_01335 [Mycoplasma ovis str. Michigan]|uniref:Uncharacterized protein n=1 Tax=Mycoplasma ovis str. Michigan TaxID=1415773 RepID=A0ABM5P0G3_9MOLU|nr:hypothetical protein [Mycoplasma ovis]AHC39884.1 hypothetical protein OVS_01335 [Mycoplasma ovis str. Michigan]